MTWSQSSVVKTHAVQGQRGVLISSSLSPLGLLCHPRITSMDSTSPQISMQEVRCCQSKSDPATCFSGNLEDVSMYCQEAVQKRCQSGVEWLYDRCSSLSLATWPKKLLHFLTIRSVRGDIAYPCTLSYLGVTNGVTLCDSYKSHIFYRICLLHFIWKDSRLLVSMASRVHVSSAYKRTDKTSIIVLYT